MFRIVTESGFDIDIADATRGGENGEAAVIGADTFLEDDIEAAAGGAAEILFIGGEDKIAGVIGIGEMDLIADGNFVLNVVALRVVMESDEEAAGRGDDGAEEAFAVMGEEGEGGVDLGGRGGGVDALEAAGGAEGGEHAIGIDEAGADGDVAGLAIDEEESAFVGF